MKFCTKCGEVYPSEVENCNVDGAALELWARTSFEAKDEALRSAAVAKDDGDDDDDDEAEVTNVEAMPYDPPEPVMAKKKVAASNEEVGASTSVVDIRDPVTLTEFDVHSAVKPVDTGDELVCYDDEEVSGPFRGMLISNRYRLETRIGTGGFGVVFDAYDKQEDKRVAIKVLSPAFSDDKRTLMRFRREAIAVSRLQHPGIVSISDFGIEDEGVSYIVMEFLPGRDVAVLLEDERHLSARRAANLVMQCAEALSAAHDQGVLHRDLKPANIFVIEDEHRVERIKIIDFGIAKDRSSNPRMKDITAASKVVGTPFYMSPEQASGNELDGRADVYSMGVILYELLTGQRPFEGPSVYDILMAHGKAKRVKPSKVRPELRTEAKLDQIVLQAIAARRDDRFPSMEAFAGALREYLEEGAEAAVPTPPIESQRYDSALEGIRRGRQTTMNQSSGQIQRHRTAVRRRVPAWAYVVPVLAIAVGVSMLGTGESAGTDTTEASEKVAPAAEPTARPVFYTAVKDEMKAAPTTDAGASNTAALVADPDTKTETGSDAALGKAVDNNKKRRKRRVVKGKTPGGDDKEGGIQEW